MTSRSQMCSAKVETLFLKVAAFMELSKPRDDPPETTWIASSKGRAGQNGVTQEVYEHDDLELTARDRQTETSNELPGFGGFASEYKYAIESVRRAHKLLSYLGLSERGRRGARRGTRSLA